MHSSELPYVGSRGLSGTMRGGGSGGGGGGGDNRGYTPGRGYQGYRKNSDAEYYRRRQSTDWDMRSQVSETQVSIASNSPRAKPGMKRQRTIVCLGSKGVGKSSLIRQYAEDSFTNAYTPTIENAFRKEAYWAGEPVDLVIRDTAGQTEGSVFQLQFGAGAHGYIIMYSVTNWRSLKDAQFVHDNLLTNLMGTTDDIPIVLVGNKCDLDSERQVSLQQGKNVAQEWGCPFIETSAKKNEHVDEVFSLMLGQIYKGEYSPPKEQSWLACACKCSAEQMTSAQQGRVVTLYLCLLMFVLICSLFTISAGLAFALSASHADRDDTVWFMIGVGAFGTVVSSVGAYGSVKLKAGAVKFAAICMVLLTAAHAAVMVYAVQDHAFKRWLKFGGAATMLVASVVDVIVQVCATMLSCVVFSIASQRFEHSSGYALFDQDHHGASNGLLVPFARHDSWSGEPTTEH